MTILLTPLVPATVATVDFAAMVPDMSAFLPGCPSLVIERTARKMATDLCQRAKPWVIDMLPIPLSPAQAEYLLESPVLYAEPTDVVDSYMVLADATKITLRWVPYATIRRNYPEWPENASGQPQYITATEVGRILLAPTPDLSATLYIRAAVRPTADALVWEQWLYDEFKRAIFHGVLHELMLMPERSWYNERMGMYHGKQWTYLLSQARDRRTRNFNEDTLSVEMRPFA
jgi:hypothetical protein